MVKSNQTKLGALYDKGRGGTKFSLFSANAEKVELCLFDKDGQETRDIFLKRKGDIWTGFVPKAKPGQYYGYRIHGAYDPDDGKRFNPHKLLIDPYAKKLAGEEDFTLRPEHFAYVVNDMSEPRAEDADYHMDTRDSAPFMPKSVVTDPDNKFNWGADKKPNTPWAKTKIYEAHAKGLTKLNPDIEESLRGTYKGLGEKAVVKHLQDLSMSALELLPLQTFIDENPGRVNYWGYAPLNYFSITNRYISAHTNNTESALKSSIKKLHNAGIEVFLDVVYNHTCEGNHLGPTLSFKGIDNESYYALQPDNKRYNIDDTGCGNLFNVNHPQVTQLVVDSLAYLEDEFRFDGLRFDLLNAMGRDPETGYAYNREAPVFKAIKEALPSIKTAGEPWDTGMGGYNLGNLPAGYYEWSDKYKETIRKTWLDGGVARDFAAAVSGSSGIFDHEGKGGICNNQGVNDLTTHDGKTLWDAMMYNQKHNLANGENNQDGSNNEISNNCGVEGPCDDPQINAKRMRLYLSTLATLAMSHGAILLRGGDEAMNTQHGNNNAYCQDSDIGWQKWPKTPDGQKQKASNFTGFMMRLRDVAGPLMCASFPHGHMYDDVHDLKDWTWIDVKGAEKTSWGECKFLGYMMNNAAAQDELETKKLAKTHGMIDKNSRILVYTNPCDHGVSCALPTLPGGNSWKRIVDTTQDTPYAEKEAMSEHAQGDEYVVPPEGFLVFIQQPDMKLDKSAAHKNRSLSQELK